MKDLDVVSDPNGFVNDLIQTMRVRERRPAWLADQRQKAFVVGGAEVAPLRLTAQC